MHHRFSLFSLVLIIATVALSGSPALAQNAERIVIGYLDETTQQGALMAFAPGDTQGVKLADLPDAHAAISPDGQWIAILPTAVQMRFNYGRVGTALTSVPVEEGEGIASPTFSSDSKYMAYVHLPTSGKTWTITLVELETSRKTELTWTVLNAPARVDPFGFYGHPRIVAWGPGNKGLYLETLRGPNQPGPFYVDLSKAAPGKAAPLPRPTPLFKGLSGARARGSMRRDPVSPDGSKLVFLYYDPSNPPANMEPRPNNSTFPPNAVAMLDLKSRQTRTVAKANKGQGIWSAAWSPDSKTVAIITGDYMPNTPFITLPHAVFVDVTSGNTTQDLTLTDDPSLVVVVPVVCADTLFFEASAYGSKGMGNPSLYSISLTEPNAQSVELFSSNILNMERCIPAR
jgi:Tol biopolymer transport system component